MTYSDRFRKSGSHCLFYFFNILEESFTFKYFKFFLLPNTIHFVTGKGGVELGDRELVSVMILSQQIGTVSIRIWYVNIYYNRLING